MNKYIFNFLEDGKPKETTINAVSLDFAVIILMARTEAHTISKIKVIEEDNNE